MSTRGCVAVGTLDKWRGVYNHSDSYPSSLGFSVWNRVAEEYPRGGLRAFCEKLLTSGRWESFELRRMSPRLRARMGAGWVEKTETHIWQGVDDGALAHITSEDANQR